VKYIIFTLIFVCASLFANPAITENRNNEGKNYNTNSGRPSDIPYNLYDAKIDTKIRQVVDRTDLTQGQDKQFFVGYGLYDEGNRYCRYVPIGALDQNAFSNDFIQKENYAEHSYFISRTALTYNECYQKAETYNAKVYTPQSYGEAYAIQEKYRDQNFWTGFYREACDKPLLSVFGEKPNYDNWLNLDRCMHETAFENEERKNVVQLSSSKITNVKGSDSYKCVIEFDSPDYKRPQKVCAPWWRVERKYQYLNTAAPVFDVSRFKKVSVPVSIDWCKPKYDDSISTSAIARTSVTCSTYQSATAESFCASNLDSSACFVDECNGIIKEKCSSPQEIELYKDYIKGTLVKPDGTKYIGKIRKDIKTYSYSCPVNYARSGEECEKYVLYRVFPALCKNPNDINETSAYMQLGSVRRPAYDDGTGHPILADIDPRTREDEPIGFFSRCDESGDNFLFSPINKISTNTKHCIRFEEKNATTISNRDCIVDRLHTEHEVQLSLNEEDIYENNSSCIRTNNLQSARPITDVDLKIGLFGNSIYKIDKLSYSDSHNQALYQDDLYYTDFVMRLLGYKQFDDSEIPSIIDDKKIDTASIMNKISQSNSAVAFDVLTKTILGQNRQSIYNGMIFFKGADYYLDLGERSDSQCNFYNNTDIQGLKLFQDNVTAVDEDLLNQFNISKNDLFIEANITTNKIEVVDENNNTVFVCPTGYSENSNDNNTTCIVDQYHCVIKGSMTNSSSAIEASYSDSRRSGLFVLQPMSKVDCVNQALSLSMDVSNFANFSSGSDVRRCILQIEDEQSDTYEPELSEHPDSNGNYTILDYHLFVPKSIEEVQNYKPNLEKIKTTSFKMNGASDILAIQEYTSGDHFGWYQTSLTRHYKDNNLNLNGEDISGFRDWPVTVEKLHYHFTGTQTLKTTKLPQPSLFNWGSGTDSVTGFSMSTLGFAGGTSANSLITNLVMNATPIVVLDGLYSAISGLLAKKNHYISNTESWTLTKELDLDKINRAGLINNYNYDTRVYEDSTGDGVLDKAVYYKQIGINSGTFKNSGSRFKQRANEILGLKMDMLHEMDAKGIDNSFGTDIEKGRVRGYPKCDWWETSCNKTKTVSRTQELNIFKDTTTHYLQATNRLIIVVPYIGDYKVSAVNSMGKVMADKNISAESFVSNAGNQIAYTQVQFGKTMELAYGIVDGNTSNACRALDIVEWGGGTSGIYYEEKGFEKNIGDSQNLFFDCQKSSDNYVEKNSPNQIIIKDLSTNSIITIPLMGKMPYANQIFLVTLGKLEWRKYSCYGDYPQCTDENFIDENK